MLTLRKISTATVAALVLSLASVSAALAQQPSLCGPVFDGAIINIAFECWNESIIIKVDSSRKESSGWQYVVDGPNDHDNAGAEFQIFGVAAKETADQLCVAYNSTHPFDTGYVDATALNGSVAWGDAFINMTTQDFKTAHDSGSLYGVRFDAKNDSGVAQTGLYKNIVAKAVGTLNSGVADRQGYENHIAVFGQNIAHYGDFDRFMSYYALNVGLNEIQSGTRLGAITLLTPGDLSALNYDFNRFPGASTVGFCFNKNLIIDACGVVGGDGSSCSDCAGVACGESVRDECGVCGGDGTSCADCRGIPNGGQDVDQCGVCGGDGSSCLDCSGKPFGTNTIDRCGVCGGDGNSCLGCSDVDNSAGQFALDGSAFKQRKLVEKAAKLLNRSLGRKSSAARNAVLEAQALYEQNWKTVWSMPKTISSCTNTDFCVSTSNDSVTRSYQEVSTALDNLVKQLVAKARKASGRKSSGRNLLQRSKQLIDGATVELAKIPSRSSVCK